MKLLKSKPARATLDGGSDWFGETDGDHSSVAEPEAVNFPVAGSIPAGLPASLLNVTICVPKSIVKTRALPVFQHQKGATKGRSLKFGIE